MIKMFIMAIMIYEAVKLVTAASPNLGFYSRTPAPPWGDPEALKTGGGIWWVAAWLDHGGICCCEGVEGSCCCEGRPWGFRRTMWHVAVPRGAADASECGDGRIRRTTAGSVRVSQCCPSSPTIESLLPVALEQTILCLLCSAIHSCNCYWICCDEIWLWYNIR